MDENDDAMIDREENYFGLQTWRMRHTFGSKDYHAIKIVNVSRNSAVVMFRWGKADQFGEVMSTDYGLSKSATNVFDRKIREKAFKSDYRREIPDAPLPIKKEQKVHFSELPAHLTPEELNYLIGRHSILFGKSDAIPTEHGAGACDWEPPEPVISKEELMEDPMWGLF